MELFQINVIIVSSTFVPIDSLEWLDVPKKKGKNEISMINPAL